MKLQLENQIVQSILSVLRPNKIILFGSHASGTETLDSDIDLLIIIDKIESRIQEKRKLRKALSGIHLPKDIMVAQQDEYDFYKNEVGSVIRDASLKGKVLWAS